MTEIDVTIEKAKDIDIEIESTFVVGKEEVALELNAIASGQTIIPESGFIFSSVTQNPIENLIPQNVRLGVQIADVEGNLEPDKPDQSKTVYPSNMQQIVSADIGYELSSVVVEPVLEQQKTVNPTTQQQIVVPDTGKWLSEVTVNPILLQTKTVEPSTQSLEVLPDSGYDGLDLVNVGAVTASIDSNIQPQNIVQGIDILGISGIAKGSGYARPSCWLPEPTFDESIDEIYVLLAIFDQDDTYNNCPLSITTNGNCYVDWGDGSSVEQITSNTQFNHTYKYGDIPVDNYCAERGYKMVWCRIYSETNAYIIGYSFIKTFTPATYAGILEVYGNITNITANSYLTTNNSQANARYHTFLEIFKLYAKNNGNIRMLSYMFYNMPKLKYIEILGSIYNSLIGFIMSCSSLQEVHLGTLTWSSSSISSLCSGYHCDMIKIESMPPFNSSGYAFDSSYPVPEKILGLNIKGKTFNDVEMRTGLTEITQLTLPDYDQTFSLFNSQLDKDALNELFESLGTVSGKTITITYSIGALTCDRTIATAKGWTVIG